MGDAQGTSWGLQPVLIGKGFLVSPRKGFWSPQGRVSGVPGEGFLVSHFLHPCFESLVWVRGWYLQQGRGWCLQDVPVKCWGCGDA